jgi:transcriptional regulator with XRE-family HTH domain
MERAQSLGEEIKNIRTDILNFTQKELADKLDITTVYMSYLEKGKKLPSIEFLTKLYKLAGVREIPAEIKLLLAEAKKQKKKESFLHTPTNIVYRLEEQGIYNYTKLKALLRKNPDNVTVIYGILTLLIKENKIAEAKKHLLQSLINIEKPEERKWLEATYYELESNFPFSIQLMKEAIKEFDKQFPRLDDDHKKTKARLLFEIACIYFRAGQNLYYDGEKPEAIENFQLSLKNHQELKKLYKEPFYQMDYAGLFFWLALLGINPEQNWKNYIKEVREALLLNYYSGVEKFKTKQWQSLYSRPYIISTVSFLVRSYAQLAKLQNKEPEARSLLQEGEFLLAQYTPIDINVHTEEYYRYYFNLACFYSLKAEINASANKDFARDLDICYKFVLEAAHGDSKNKVKLLKKELESSDGLAFFRKERTNQVEELRKAIEN